MGGKLYKSYARGAFGLLGGIIRGGIIRKLDMRCVDVNGGR